MFKPLTREASKYKPFPTFALSKEKQYKQQFADIYFLRLTKLKPVMEKIAAETWDGFQMAGETVRRVPRVLDVRQGQLCWVVGTIYMDMPLKPNILDDISKDVGPCCRLLRGMVADVKTAALDLGAPSKGEVHLA